MRLLCALLTISPVFARAADCAKAAERIALAEAKKTDQSANAAKGTRKTDAGTAGEEKYAIEVHDKKGSFTPYDVVVTKKGCKKVSIQAGEL